MPLGGYICTANLVASYYTSSGNEVGLFYQSRLPSGSEENKQNGLNTKGHRLTVMHWLHQPQEPTWNQYAMAKEKNWDKDCLPHSCIHISRVLITHAHPCEITGGALDLLKASARGGLSMLMVTAPSIANCYSWKLTSSLSTFSFPLRSLLVVLSCKTVSSSRAFVCSLSSKS